MVGVDLGVNDVPIVGEPIAFGTGFIVLLFVLFSPILARYPVTLAHEGGHMLANLLTLRGTRYWNLKDNADGETVAAGPGIWLTRIFSSFVAYIVPSFLGLAAAALIAAGNPWAVLLVSIVLSVLAVARSRNALAFLIPGLITLGLGWLLIAGTPSLQAAFAVAIAWLLLLGGLLRIVRVLGGSGDSEDLRKMTLIPEFVWSLTWLFIGLVSLVVGAQLLLRPGYAIV
ncbi:M50 family metallopeptidase [Actinomycetospora chibensis]|uniref:M50 family metallopeptidase n=1 Tax=Actinomycetospora chibensis TaxID=663606 RepID=A0ABV9RGS1_9PSEU|nr:M50 family metallopeptidase [Actinomycetospora chibensis]MDD7924526.1 M50 family metallopeptidase [Actinomycetospora chibensis]